MECRQDTAIAGIISVGPYSNHALQRGIAWLKFKGVRDMADILAGLMIPHLARIAPLEELSARAILVPIPLHKNKLRHRGFNQSEDIAQAIGKLCGIEVVPALKRIKRTQSQAKLSHDQRPNNMNNAFALAMPEQKYAQLIAKKPIIILLDDVATTGSTLFSASRAFPENAHAKIWCVVVARG